MAALNKDTPIVTSDTIKRLAKDVKDIMKNPLTDNGIYYTHDETNICLLYTSPSPRDATLSRMPSSA